MLNSETRVGKVEVCGHDVCLLHCQDCLLAPNWCQGTRAHGYRNHAMDTACREKAFLLELVFRENHHVSMKCQSVSNHREYCRKRRFVVLLCFCSKRSIFFLLFNFISTWSKHSRTGFLGQSTIDIMDQIIIYCGEAPCSLKDG